MSSFLLMRLYQVNQMLTIINPKHPFYLWSGQVVTINQVDNTNMYGIIFNIGIPNPTTGEMMAVPWNPAPIQFSEMDLLPTDKVQEQQAGGGTSNVVGLDGKSIKGN